MQKLPVDLIIEIFDRLDFNDLRNMTETCKRFNSIVGNSITLMKKFQLAIEREAQEVKLSGTRKYRNVKIWYNNEKMHKILQEIGENIVCLNFRYIEISVDELAKLLSFCLNLKRLNLNELKIKPTKGHSHELPKLMLESLELFECDDAMLKLFDETIIEELWPNVNGFIRCNDQFFRYKIPIQRIILQHRKFGRLFQTSLTLLKNYPRQNNYLSLPGDDSYKFHDILPYLEYLSIERIDFEKYGDPFKFYNGEIKIRSLFLDWCKNYDWLYDLLRSGRMKLMYLLVKGGIMKKSQHEFLKSLQPPNTKWSINITHEYDLTGNYVEDYLDED